MTTLHVTVHHLAAPQGSKRHVGGGRMVESSKRCAPYRDSVHAAALAAMPASWERRAGPVTVVVEFFFPRPQSHYRAGRYAHLLKPSAPSRPTTRTTGDIDKLVRATLDGLAATTGAGVFVDDAQVVGLAAYKHWAQRPRVDIAIRDIPGERT